MQPNIKGINPEQNGKPKPPKGGTGQSNKWLKRGLAVNRYILCCDNGRWYETEAENEYKAIKAVRNFGSGDAVVFVFNKENCLGD